MRFAILLLLLFAGHRAAAAQYGPWIVSPVDDWTKIEYGPGCGTGSQNALFRNGAGNIWIQFTYGGNAASGILKAADLSIAGRGELFSRSYVKCGFGKANSPIYVFQELNSFITIIVLKDGVQSIRDAIAHGCPAPDPEELTLRLAEADNFLGSAVSVVAPPK